MKSESTIGAYVCVAFRDNGDAPSRLPTRPRVSVRMGGGACYADCPGEVDVASDESLMQPGEERGYPYGGIRTDVIDPRPYVASERVGDADLGEVGLKAR